MLIDQIKADQLQARKDRNSNLAQLLTTFYSEAAMIGKNDGDRATTDEEVQTIAKKFIKNANEVMANLPDSDDRYNMAVFEIVNLTGYLPQQMTDDELMQEIAAIIATYNLNSPRDMGTIMKELKSNKAGLYDGAKASQLAKAQLAGF